MAITFGDAKKSMPQLFLESRASGKVVGVNALDNLTVSHAIDLTPAVLKCEILTLKNLTIAEGDAVILTKNNANIFKGYVTDIVRDERGSAYDQLFYFRYHDTYFYENKSAGDILKKWVSYFSLKSGNIDCNTHKIPTRNEWNRSIRDMLKFALDETYYQTGVRLILFDKGGKIHLERTENLAIDFPTPDLSAARGFSHHSSISYGAINRVKLAYKDPKTGVFEIFTAKNDACERDWGILQYYNEINDNSTAQSYAERMLKQRCSVANTYSVRGIPLTLAEHLHTK